MTQTDLFGMYVEERLQAWGREFAYHRDRIRAGGYRSKNMLQVLIEHKGEMPARPTGWKPEEVDLLAMQVEDIVREMMKAGERSAGWALRAYYCGNGRVGVERLDLYRALIGRRCGKKTYYAQVDTGRIWVRHELMAECRTGHLRTETA